MKTAGNTSTAANVGTSPELRLRVVESEHDWVGLRSRWDHLLGRSRQATIFLTWEWMNSWVETFFDEAGAEARALHVLVMEDHGGDLLGAAPLYRESSGRSGSASLRLIADRYVCSDYLEFPVVVDRESEFARLIASHFASMRVASSLLLSAVADGSFIQAVVLPTLASRAGYWTLELKRDVCPQLPLGPDFKGAYNRKYAKLKKSGDAAITYARSVEDTVRGLEELFHLHQANWTRRGQPGSFCNERLRDFYRRLATGLVPIERLRLYTLTMDGKTVATNIGFAYRDEWYGMQAGYDEDWARHSVGGILQGQILKGLAKEGFRRVHFLRGDETYKYEHWEADPSYQRDYRLFQPRPANLYRYYIPHVARRIKRRSRAWARSRSPG